MRINKITSINNRINYVNNFNSNFKTEQKPHFSRQCNSFLPNFTGNTNFSNPDEFKLAKINGNKLLDNSNKICLSSADELAALANTPEIWQGHKFKLISDIDLSAVKNFKPIGNNNIPFSSEFDGAEHAISNMHIISENNLGLFGNIKNATIHDLTINDAEISGKNQIGILAGNAANSLIKNVFIQNGKINGTERLGGITGISNDCNFVQNSIQVALNGERDIGSVSGFDTKSSISNIYSKCKLYGQINIGGLLGYGMTSKIDNCEIYPSITAKNNTGDLIGKSKQTNISNIIILSNQTIYPIGSNDNSELTNTYKNKEILEIQNFDKSIWETNKTFIPHLNFYLKNKSFEQISKEDLPFYMNILEEIPDKILESDFIDINFQDNKKRIPLYYCRSAEQAEIMIKKGADIFHEDIYNQTPMHKYCPEGNVGVVKILLNNGASYFSKDINGESPLELAKKSGHKDIIQNCVSGNTGFAKVIGMDELKENLTKNIISPLKNPKYKERGIKPVNGFILHGLPRTGKTFIAIALAQELKKDVHTIKCTDFGNMYQHESANKLSEKFDEILSKNNAAILLDDFESIAPERGDLYGGNEAMVDLNEQVNVLLEKLIECNEKSILVIATTNHPEKIDKAVKSRFEKMFFVPPPDLKARMVLFREQLGKIQNVEIDSKVNFKELAKKTKNYTAEKIASVVNEANIISINDGSDTITMKNLTDAIKKIKPSISQSDLEEYKLKIATTDSHGTNEQPKITTFADVAGMEDIKSKLEKDIILPLKNSKLYEEIVGEFPNGHLLYGAPGCGKTWIAKALAGESGRNFIEMDSSAASSPVTIKKVFNDAKFNAPSILFIDEIEAFVPPRGIGVTTVSDNKITSEFLRQLNECASENVYVIAATNHPELIDDAIKRTGRFDRKTFVPPLDQNARMNLFKMKLENNKRTANDINYEELAGLTKNYTAAQINKIVRDAQRSVYEDVVKNIDTNSLVTQKKLIKQINDTEPELTDEIIEKYRNL